MPPVEKLTAREQEILDAMAEGKQDDEIAWELHFSRETVRQHNKHIYAKLGVHNRTQAVASAYHNGLLWPRPRGDGPVLNTNVSRSS